MACQKSESSKGQGDGFCSRGGSAPRRVTAETDESYRLRVTAVVGTACFGGGGLSGVLALPGGAKHCA